MSRKAPLDHKHLSDTVTIFSLQVPTADVGHLKHLLEAMDNLCVCSTRPDAPTPEWRDVDITVPGREGAAEIRRFLERLRGEVPWRNLTERPLGPIG